MSRSSFPSDLTYEITSADLAADWLLLQKAGERKQGKAHPSVIAAAKSDTNPVALGTAAPGTGTTVSRTDHVHPTTGLLKTSDLSSTNPVALGTASAGTGSTVSRTDHVHPTTGLLTTAALSGAGPAGLGSVPLSGSSSSVSRDDHVHQYPTLSQLGAAPASHFSVAAGGQLNFHNDYGYRFVNVANSVWGDIDAGDIVYTTATARSDPRIKRDITVPTQAVPTGKSLAQAVITYHLKSDPTEARRRMGFSAATLAEVAPDAAVALAPDPDIPEEQGLDRLLGIDVMALLAILTRQIAALEDRLDQMSAVNGLVKPSQRV